MIAVIGGEGFIGSQLTRCLEQDKRNFCVIDIQTSIHETIFADVRDADALTKALSQSSCIVNLAAEHRDDVTPVSRYTEVNVDGARNVCNAARINGINTIVFTSTVAVYGLGSCVNESDEPQPFNEYGRTKLQAEKIYINWQKEKPQERTLVIVRPSVVFGEGNRGNVYNLLKQIASGFFIMVGKGTNKKSMSYVKNMATFLKYLITANLTPGAHLYNYADKPDMDMNMLVSTVRKELGLSNSFLRLSYWFVYLIGIMFDVVARITSRTFTISAIRVKKFCATTQVSCEWRKGLSFQQAVSLKDGIKRTVASLGNQ